MDTRERDATVKHNHSHDDTNKGAQSVKSNEPDNSSRSRNFIDWICFPSFPGYWVWALCAALFALLVTVIVYNQIQSQPPNPRKVDENFKSLKGVTAFLPFPACNITSDLKGEIAVQTRVYTQDHFLHTSVQILAQFFTTMNYRVIDPNLLKVKANDALFGEAINTLHQRILTRRLSTTTHDFETPLDHRDFIQTDDHKCICSSALSEWSFVSLKFITFDSDKSMLDKIAHIRKNSTFDISILPAIPRTGIINATKYTSFTIKNLKCPVALQVTEILKLVPAPTDPSVASKMDPTIINKIKCWAGTESCEFRQAIQPGPDTCRHVTVSFLKQEDRFIPETVVSAFFCH